MDIGQLRVGKGYLMVTIGQQGSLKENLTELHIIVRTTGFTFYIQDHYFNFATVESRWLSLIKTNIQQIWTQFNQPSSLHHQETFDQEFIQSQLNWISKNTSIWLIASDWNSQKGIFACDNKFQKKDFVKFNEIIFKDFMFPGMLCLTLAPTTVI